MGLEECIGWVFGIFGYVSYKNVCVGGEFSIDWCIYLLCLQFCNSVGDFQECLFVFDFRFQGFLIFFDFVWCYFMCNMGQVSD